MAETEKNLSSSLRLRQRPPTRPRWGTSHGLNSLAMIVRDLGQLEDARPHRDLRRAAVACTASKPSRVLTWGFMRSATPPGSTR